MKRYLSPLALCVLLIASGCGKKQGPFVIVLGIAQDGGVPQPGSQVALEGQQKRHVVSLAIVDPRHATRWLIECTPDFPEQLHALHDIAPVDSSPGLDGIFLTHAHVGHYTGLMHLGHEVMGARGVPVYVMPRMAEYLARNGPWSQLVRYNNIMLRRMTDGRGVSVGPDLAIIPFLVPHRQEYSEVVGYRIVGPNRSVLFIPDIDSWSDLDDEGTRIEELIRDVDVAYIDGTFYADGEIPGRDMSTFPHPFITTSMERFASLSDEERTKVRFIHLNHTNPALVKGGDTQRLIKANGFRVAAELERIDL